MLTTLTQNKILDAKLGQRVYNSLLGLGYCEYSALQCDAIGETVTLRGDLPSHYLKQIAQTIAKKVPGIRNVVDEINVCEETFEAKLLERYGNGNESAR